MVDAAKRAERRGGPAMTAAKKPAAPTPDVRIGDVWEDCDRRHWPRRIRVVRLTPKRNALCENVDTGRSTVIAVARFTPKRTGYRLVSRGAP